MATIFAAANMPGLAANCGAVLVAFVGVSLLFVAYRYLQYSMSKPIKVDL